MPMRSGLCLPLLLAICLPSWSGAAEETFDRDIRPLLRQLCFRCHGPDKQEADLRLDQLDPDMVEGADAETWHDALNKLNLGEMPPAESPQPSESQLRTLTTWLQAELRRAAEARRADGHATLRRLTRYEYQNTMGDLLGVELDYARDLPPDPTSPSGFQNGGASLGISPMQVELYLKAARRGLSRALVTGPAPEVFTHHAEKTEQARRKKAPVSNRLAPGAQFLARMEAFPREGEVRVQVRARNVSDTGAEHPRMQVTLGVRADVRAPASVLGEADVSAGESATYEFRGRIEEFPLPGHNPKFPGLQITIYNVAGPADARAGKKGNKADKPPQDGAPVPELLIESVDFEGPLYDQWPPASHRRILFDMDRPRDAGDERAYCREVLSRFMRRAFRRPPQDEEVDGMVSLFDKVRPRSPDFVEAMRETLSMVLISPQFLYLAESGDSGAPLDDHQFATRMSYFLWSTMPDQRLMELADRGELRKPESLRSEVRRMLADPRSWALVEHFAGQWLDTAGVNRVAVNPEHFPQFDARLKRDMRDETLHFFAEILEEDLSCLNLLDSNFAMLNRRLAINYGVEPAPPGSDFQRVELADSRRGGVLTQGSFLLSNSNGGDTHPIRRAVWILDRLLDDPPPPPPPDVPSLDPEQADLQGQPLKRQLELHRAKQACANCHRGIDPWGVTLENYDAIGRWREQVPAVKGRPTSPVESQATLPGGAEIDGVVQLKRYLVEQRREQFARSLSKRMLAYALGRPLGLADHAQIERLTKRLIDSEYRLSELVVAVVESEAFGSR